MHRYTIHRLWQPWSLSEIIAINAVSAVLLAARLGWYETDVLRDGLYNFTVRIDENGLWSILSHHAEIAVHNSALTSWDVEV